jgi:hypothetical protein
MEPVMMNLGMVCGAAAAMACAEGVTSGELDVAALQQKLESMGQVVRVTRG